MAVSQVLFLRAIACQSRTTGVVIKLSVCLTNPSFWFLIPAGWCPYQSLGCSLVGFTPFHFFRFQKNYVTVALSGYSQHILLGLSIISPPSVDKIYCPPLQMARTLRASQHRASLDFPQLM